MSDPATHSGASTRATSSVAIRAAGSLFWVMLIAGFATLAPCLLLPAWIDYQQARAARDAKRREIDFWKARIAGQQREIEHLHSDPAYLERLARAELGMETPGMTTLLIDTHSVSIASEPEIEPPSSQDRFPRLTAWLTEGLDRFPRIARMLLSAPTRLMIGSLGAAVIVAAILLLGPIRTARAPDERPPDQGPAIISD